MRSYAQKRNSLLSIPGTTATAPDPGPPPIPVSRLDAAAKAAGLGLPDAVRTVDAADLAWLCQGMRRVADLSLIIDADDFQRSTGHGLNDPGIETQMLVGVGEVTGRRENERQ